MSSYREAWDAATKEGDRHMRCRGGTEWNRGDILAANDEMVRRCAKTDATMFEQMKLQGQAAGNETG